MNKGFSLVELIVVIAIMAILVGVAVPVYTSYIDKAEDAVDEQLLGEIEHAIEVLLIDPEAPECPADAVITVGTAGISVTSTNNAAGATAFEAAIEAIVKGNTSVTYEFSINGYDATYAPAA